MTTLESDSQSSYFGFEFHLALAPAWAIADRSDDDSRLALALPPRLPSSAAADFTESSFSVSSPVAIRMTLTALPITSAGCFSPRGPLGIGSLMAKRCLD